MAREYLFLVLLSVKLANFLELLGVDTTCIVETNEHEEQP